MSLKKIPGLFQDFQGPFLQFSRTKNHKLAIDFHRSDAFTTTLRSVAPGKIYWINFVRKSGSFIDKVNNVLSGYTLISLRMVVRGGE